MVFVRAGSGGAGSNAMKFGKGRQHMKPTGGSGGDGGSVVFTVDASCNTLLGFRGRSNYRAEHGSDGDLEYANGVNGEDFFVPVPLGTVVTDNTTQLVLGELTEPGQRLVVAGGGMGGRGNAALKTKDGSGAGASPPQGGEKRWLKLELKLVADVGLIGVPNAGKSTLLGAITSAKPKIASYAFTTIIPNLGVCEVGGRLADGGTALVIADIPGLVEGAHKGVGLGRGFLRHIERCKIILHLVNGDSYPECLREFEAINKELQLFSEQLASKPQVVVLNKVDLPHVEERRQEIMDGLLKLMPHTRLLCISAAGRVGTSDLVERTYKFLLKVRADEEEAAAAAAAGAGAGASASASAGAGVGGSGSAVGTVSTKAVTKQPSPMLESNMVVEAHSDD
jgi:GTP-binding protein